MKKFISLLLLVILLLLLVFYLGGKKDSSSQTTALPPAASQTAVEEPPVAEVDLPHFFYACQTGELPIVEQFVKQGEDINKADENGYTCLMMASYNDRLEVVQWLVENGAALEVTSNRGKTAVMLAAQGNAVTSLNYLLRAGANLLAKDNKGRTVMQLARDNTAAFLEDWQEEKETASDSPKVVAVHSKNEPISYASANARESGKPIDQQLLEAVCFFDEDKNDLTPIRRLIEMNANLDYLAPPSPHDVSAYTPLGCAIKKNYVHIAELLLKSGADVQKKYGAASMTPLMHSALEDRPEIASLLIHYRADVNECDSSYHSALDYARYKKSNVATILLSNGAKENACKILYENQQNR